MYCMFYIAFLRWSGILPSLCCMYGTMREQKTGGQYRSEDAQPIAVFDIGIGKMETASFIELYKARFVDIKDRFYTLLQTFMDKSETDIFLDFHLPFYVPKDAEMQGTTQVAFFQAFLKTLKRNEAFEVSGRDELDLKTIFNHAVESQDQANQRK